MLILISLPNLKALAQTACTQSLDRARIAFDDGRIHEIANIVEECLTINGFTEAEKTEALRLLVMSHIYLEEPEKADQRMLELLQHEHEYQINEAVDPTEFILLYQTFRTDPIFRVGFKGGINATIVNPNEVNGTFDLTETERGEYSIRTGLMGGLSFEYEINEDFTINPEVYFSLQSFEKTSTLPFDPNPESTNLGTSQLTVVEDQSWIRVPIQGQYKFMDNKFNPYVSLGGSFDYLLASETAGDETETAFQNEQDRSFASFDMIDSREPINISIVAGVGTKFKLGEGFLVGELRFYYGVLNSVKEGMFYDNPTTFTLLNADDQFKQHMVTFSIGYIKNIYAPKKLTP